MAGAVTVSDSISNFEEQIQRAARIVGTGQVRPLVFSAIYHHKAKIKSVSLIVKRTKLPRMRVLQEGRHLVRNGVVNSAAVDGETAYEMIPIFHTHKRRILKLAANPKALAALPTKRNISVKVKSTSGKPSPRPKVVALTVDDVDSFSSIHAVKPIGYISPAISEDTFKRGIQKLLGEAGDWRDWGGELFDLASARVLLKGKRIGTVFAFKGPGTKGDLVPGKMGKNGDQIPRMFLADGRLFVVQFVRGIKPSINQLMRSLAVDKAVATGDTIYYMLIDGTDSDRLVRAYPRAFSTAAKGKRAEKVK